MRITVLSLGLLILLVGSLFASNSSSADQADFVSSFNYKPSEPTPLPFDQSELEIFFLDKLAHFQALEEQGNTATAQILYDKQSALKAIQNYGNGSKNPAQNMNNRNNQSFELEGEAKLDLKTGKALVQYPSLGLFSVHENAKAGDRYTLSFGGEYFQENVKDAKGTRAEGLFLCYNNEKLFCIRSTTKPDLYKWSRNLRYGPSLEWEKSTREIICQEGPDGLETHYWLNQKKRAEGRLNDGRRIGVWTFYYPSGEKEAEFTYDGNEHITSYEGWYEGGAKLCRGYPPDTDPTLFEDMYQLTRDLSVDYWDPQGHPLYAYSAQVTDEKTPQTLVYWPNGKPAIRAYDISGAGTCQCYEFDLGTPDGSVFYEASELGDPGAHGLGCDVQQKPVAIKKPKLSGLPNGPVTLGDWYLLSLASWMDYKDRIFGPVLYANIGRGKLEGKLVITQPQDPFRDPTGSGLTAIFNFKNGLLDGKSVVALGDIHLYEFKKGKLVSEQDLWDEDRGEDFLEHLNEVLEGRVQLPQAVHEDYVPLGLRDQE